MLQYQYLNKLLIIASHATELQYLKIAYQSEFEVPTASFFNPQYHKSFNLKDSMHFCMQYCKHNVGFYITMQFYAYMEI